MKIDFSDYVTLTENDIIAITKSGIETSNGIISFIECNENFIEEHKIKGSYIGEFDSSGSNLSIALYTAPLTAHFFFMENQKSFYQTIKTIKEYGYEFIDRKELF